MLFYVYYYGVQTYLKTCMFPMELSDEAISVTVMRIWTLYMFQICYIFVKTSIKKFKHNYFCKFSTLRNVHSFVRK